MLKCSRSMSGGSWCWKAEPSNRPKSARADLGRQQESPASAKKKGPAVGAAGPTSAEGFGGGH